MFAWIVEGKLQFSHQSQQMMLLLVTFFHLLKINDTIKVRFTDNRFKSDTSLTRTVWSASWEKRLYIFSKFNFVEFYGPLNIDIKGVWLCWKLFFRGASRNSACNCTHAKMKSENMCFLYVDDHSRVVLKSVRDTPGSDYINANYVDVSLSINRYPDTGIF